MNVSRMGRRLAVSGVATAIAAAGLVGASTTAATAVTGGAAYNCVPTALPVTLPIPVSVEGTLPPSAVTGFELPDNFLKVNVSFTAPASVLGMLAGVDSAVTQVGASTDNFDLNMVKGAASTVVPLHDIDVPLTAVPAAGQDLVMPQQVALESFKLPDAGAYDINMPPAFDLTVSTNSAAHPAIPMSCSLADGSTAKVTSLTLDKQMSTTLVKAPKSIKKSKHAKAVVSVRGQYVDAKGGKVVVQQLKKGKLGKVLAHAKLVDGKAKLTLPKLKPGKYTFEYSYKGDRNTLTSSADKKLKVTR